MNLVRHSKVRVYSLVRIFVFAAIVILLLAQASETQKISDPPHPILDYRCPTYELPGNTPIIIRAEVVGTKQLDEQELKRIVFKWELSQGKLLGQGTGQVTLDLSGIPKDRTNCVDLKLEVEGAPPYLEREKTCKLRIDPKCTEPALLDEYGSVSSKEELRHLDHFANYLSNAGSESISYLISYAGRSACIYEAQWRVDRAKEYLVEKHKVSKNRIVTVDGGVRENWSVDLFLQRDGGCGPLPSPTLLRDDAQVSGLCSQKYNESKVQ